MLNLTTAGPTRKDEPIPASLAIKVRTPNGSGTPVGFELGDTLLAGQFYADANLVVLRDASGALIYEPNAALLKPLTSLSKKPAARFGSRQ